MNIGGQRLQEGGRKVQEFISLEEEMWFTKSQIRKCERAVIAAIRQPLSGRRLLSGEYMPVFEIPQQESVREKIVEVADANSKGGEMRLLPATA